MNYNIEDSAGTATQTLAHEAAAIVSTTTFSTVREGSSLVIRVNGVESGVRPAINLSAGAGILISGSDDNINDEVDLNFVVTSAPPPELTIVTKTTNYNVSDNDDQILVDCTAGALTMSLHAVATAYRKRYVFKKIDATANAMTIDTVGAELIDGVASVNTTTPLATFTVFPDAAGAAWWIE